MRLILVLALLAAVPLASLATMPPEAMAASANSLSAVLTAVYGDPMQRLDTTLHNGLTTMLHPLVLCQMLGDQMLAMGAWGEAVMTGARKLSLEPGYLRPLRPLLVTVNSTLWGVGMIFSVVLPTVPMVYFFSAAIGWLVSVITGVTGSMLLSARLVVAGEANAVPLMQVLLDIIFRPSLICLGYVAGGMLVWGFCVPFYLMFSYSLTSFNSIAGLAGTLGGLVVFARILIYVMAKAFSLCHLLPDMVINFYERKTVKLV